MENFGKVFNRRIDYVQTFTARNWATKVGVILIKINIEHIEVIIPSKNRSRGYH